MHIVFEPIGYVRTDVDPVPRHWTLSNAEGVLRIDEKYREGLKDIQPGQHIVVIFHFHRSPKFTSLFLTQQPPHHEEKLGVFSICSPYRPNPIGMSVVEVLSVEGGVNSRSNPYFRYKTLY